LPRVVAIAPPLHAVYRLTRLVAYSRASVLLVGETGTGKEVIARNIHRISPPRRRSLRAGQLWRAYRKPARKRAVGHIKGAFTGAVDNKTGRFEAAHGGTIFLDEINSMSPKLQVKLLRRPAGTRVRARRREPNHPRRYARHRRDQRLSGRRITAGRFREDLYYRLNVVPIYLPPLR